MRPCPHIECGGLPRLSLLFLLRVQELSVLSQVLPVCCRTDLIIDTVISRRSISHVTQTGFYKKKLTSSPNINHNVCVTLQNYMTHNTLSTSEVLFISRPHHIDEGECEGERGGRERGRERERERAREREAEREVEMQSEREREREREREI